MIIPGAPLFGIQIISSEILGDPWQDWSQVRSPGRAARRLKRGFPQRIVTRYRPNGKLIVDQVRGVIYCHLGDRLRIEEAIRRMPQAMS